MVVYRESSIGWTGRQRLNAVTYCDKVSEECRNCYMFPWADRLKGMGQEKYNHDKVTIHPELIEEPLKWKKPQRMFVNSMSDMFHKDVPLDFLQKSFDVFARCPHIHFQILTKRSERLAELAPHLTWSPNIWMGVSVGLRRYLSRIDDLRKVPAAVRFLSLEPLLEPLTGLDLTGIHWGIVGGESGPNCRGMRREWVIEIKDIFEQAGVLWYFKQWGGGTHRTYGRALDGKLYSGYPVLLPGEVACPVSDAPEDDRGQRLYLAKNLPEFREQGTSRSQNPFPKLDLIQIEARKQGTAGNQKVFPEIEGGPAMKYQQKRRVLECMNCHMEKEIHAHGLCITCYRADERAHQRAEDTQAANREQQKTVTNALRNHTAILTALHKQGVPQRVIDVIRVQMRPFFAAVDYLFKGSEGDIMPIDAEDTEDERLARSVEHDEVH